METRFAEGSFDAGILLVNAATGAHWFQRVWHRPAVFFKGRVKFIKSSRSTAKEGDSPTHYQVAFYFGPSDGAARFKEVFSPIGRFVPALEEVHHV